MPTEHPITGEPVETAQSRAQDARDATAYRDLMDSVDSGRFETNDATLATLQDGLTAKLRQGEQYSPGALDSDTAKTIVQTQTIMSNALSFARQEARSTTEYLRDGSVWPGEKREKAPDMIRASVEKVDNAKLIAEAAIDATIDALYAATQPTVKDGEQTTARADARMLLDGASDPGEIMRRVSGYLESDGNDSVSGLLADQKWLRTYLSGRGLDPKLIDGYSSSIRETVARNALNSADNRRKTSAQAIGHVKNMRAGLDVLASARNVIDPRRVR